MQTDKKIYVIGEQKEYANWLKPIGYSLSSTIEGVDLVMFTGGEDVCPDYYKEKAGKYTNFNRIRDSFEEKIFNMILERKIPMIGICRGCQFLNVMNGGKLIQHMNHPRRHFIDTFDKRRIPVTSSHHQMSYPYNLPEEDYKIIGWATGEDDVHFLSNTFLNGENKEMNMENKKEVEIIFFPKTKCLGIQSHPEWLELNCYSTKYMQELVTEFLSKE